MTELDLEIILLRAKEVFPNTNLRIISDNGLQFTARDFKDFIRLMEMSHVRTSPYYPQSNGKSERYHRSIKSECIRPAALLSLEDGRSLITRYVSHYNTVRLHSAIAYITPVDKLLGQDQTIFAVRKAKLLAARSARISNPPLAP